MSTAALLGEFAGPDALEAAMEALRRRGFTRLEAHAPYPLDWMRRQAGVRRWPLPVGAAVAAVGGFALSLAVQAHAHLDYPLNVGGRPVLAWTAFLLPALQFAALSAVIAAAVGMLLANGLPRLHHPLFEVERFRAVTDDGFFLSVAAADPLFTPGRVEAALREAGALRVWEVPG